MPQISASERFVELPHPADIALLVKGGTLDALFMNAADALYHIMGAIPLNALGPSRSFHVFGMDNESRLVAFLSELLYLADSDILATDFALSFSGDTLFAQYLPFSFAEKKRHIKAVTYNQMKIRLKDNKFQTIIVMDI